MGKRFNERLLVNYSEDKIALFNECIEALKKSKNTILAKQLIVIKHDHELGLALTKKMVKKIGKKGNGLGGDELDALDLDEFSFEDDFEPDPYLALGVGL